MHSLPRLGDVRNHEWLQPAADALEDSHVLWHEAADAYHEPADFRRKVEALIQTLRNVTFRLQASKSEGPESFSWYEGEDDASWRTWMRNDEYMKWLHDARTQITKRKGLGHNSLASVAVVEGYDEPRKVLLKLPADVPTTFVVHRATQQIDEKYRAYLTIEVLRRWEPSDLEGSEVLSVLRYCLVACLGLLFYAAEISEGNDPGTPTEFLSETEIPGCLVMTPDHVPLLFEADTEDEVMLVVEWRESTPEEEEEARKRYGSKVRIAETTEPSIEAFAELIHEGSRAAFKKDGYVLPFAFLISEDSFEQYGTLADDKRGKYLMWRDLGRRALWKDTIGVVHTAESWLAEIPTTPTTPYLEGADQPNRKEVISTTYESRDGNRGTITSLIHRVGPLSFLSKPFMEDEHVAYFMNPVRRAWKIREMLKQQAEDADPAEEE